MHSPLGHSLLQPAPALVIVSDRYGAMVSFNQTIFAPPSVECPADQKAEIRAERLSVENAFDKIVRARAALARRVRVETKFAVDVAGICHSLESVRNVT